MKKITIEKIVKFGIGSAILVFFSFVVLNYSSLASYAIIAVLFSYILDPFVNKMQAVGMNRTLAITLTMSTMILLLVYISSSIIPIIATQVVSLTGQLSVESLQEIFDKIELRLEELFPFLPELSLKEKLTTLLDDILDFDKIKNVFSNALGIFTDVFSAVLVVPFATFFFLKDGTKIRRDLLRFVPNIYYETVLTVIDKIEKRLGLYFRSVLFQSLIVATLSFILLTIVGLKNALAIGIAIGVANTIPYFGPIIGYFLSMTVAILETGDFNLVAPALLAIFLVQLIDNIVLQPFIFSRSADMHPVAILFIILVGAQTAGFLGMLVAIPIATIIKITIVQVNWSFNNYYIFKNPSHSSTLKNFAKT